MTSPTDRKHAALSPSKLDYWAECPCYEGKQDAGPAAQAGTNQHTYAETLLKGWAKPTAHELGLDLADKENCEWYVEYVKGTASGLHEIEVSLELLDDDFNQITFGTADFVAGNEIFDYKSDREERNHKLQMAAYALMLMRRDGLATVTCHLCYGKLRKVVKHTFTQAEAWALIRPVMAERQNPDRKPMPCEYCGWCAAAESCPALVTTALEVARQYSDPPETFAAWHASEVSDPAVMSRMLTVARWVKAWADSVEQHAKTLAQSQGVMIPGYRLTERKGAREIVDLQKAFDLCSRNGLTQQAFLKVCSVTITKLEEVYAAAVGKSKAVSKRELNELLAECIKEKPGFAVLMKERTEKQGD